MEPIEHSIANRGEGLAYVAIEPWPHCFELKPGEVLSFVWTPKAGLPALQTDYDPNGDLTIWPNGEMDDRSIMIDGKPALHRSWKFERNQ